MRLRKNHDDCNYCMEIFKDFENQLKKNATAYLKSVCTFENSMVFKKSCINFVDSIPSNLLNDFILRVNSIKICQTLNACKWLQKEDVEYVETNDIEMDDRFYDEWNDIPVESVEQLQQLESNHAPHKSDAFKALINAVMR